MKNFRNLIAAFIIIGLPFAAISKNHKPLKTAKKTIQLKISQSSGTNGSAVAYNPHMKLYYAVIAGNGDYPLETFSSTGTLLHESSADSDMRGLWWNSKLKQLEGNCYGDVGYIKQKLNSQSYAANGTEMILAGKNQPDANSIGVFNAKKNQVLFYDAGSDVIIFYNRKTGEPHKKKVFLQTNLNAQFNSSSFIFTGVKKMEIGLLDYEHKTIHLFNMKNGEHTHTIDLPEDAYCSRYFMFSYANKQIWLYNENSRSWTGYLIFK